MLKCSIALTSFLDRHNYIILVFLKVLKFMVDKRVIINELFIIISVLILLNLFKNILPLLKLKIDKGVKGFYKTPLLFSAEIAEINKV